MRLVSVYRSKGAPKILWRMMKVRLAESKIDKRSFVNISHRRLPSWRQHLAFIKSRANGKWYIIFAHRKVGEEPVGWIYLSPRNEIGIVLFPEYRGLRYGSWAIEAIMKKHPRERFLANINPANKRSIKLFRKFDFTLLQQTYELRP